MIYIDLTELALWAQRSDLISGIQRVVYNLARDLEEDPDVGFVVLADGKGSWIRLRSLNLDNSGNIKHFNLLNENWRISRIKWSHTRNRIREARGSHKIKPLVRFVESRLVRPFLNKSEWNLKGIKASLMKEKDFQEGDVLVEPAIPFCNDFIGRIEPLQEKVKLVFFYHDLIPLTCREFVLGEECANFQKYFDLMLHRADLLITSAKFNVDGFRKQAALEHQDDVVPPIEAIGLPVEFSASVTNENYFEISPIIRRLSAYKFCLCVGTIGPRKNHFELLQAWKKFYDSDAYNNEILVVAGAPWGSASDIVNLLHNKAFCGGSIVYFDRPSDLELAFLYQECRFSLYLSLFEGWGLPVSESIAVGKPVVILNSTTLPEAGYGAADVVATRTLADMQKMIERMFGDNEYYEASLRRVLEAKQKLPTWSDFSKRLIKVIRKHV